MPANHVPEASVIRGARALPGITGRKEMRRRPFKSTVKSLGPTEEPQSILEGLRNVGGSGIPGGAVKCVDIRRNTEGEGNFLDIS